MEARVPSPPVPARPGQASRIQSIDSLRPEAKPNEYVETTTRGVPTLASVKTNSTKCALSKDSELQQNVHNERKEKNICIIPTSTDDPPVLPPRVNRAPPLPHRLHAPAKTVPIPSQKKTVSHESNGQGEITSKQAQLSPMCSSKRQTVVRDVVRDGLAPAVLIMTPTPAVAGLALGLPLHKTKPIDKQPKGQQSVTSSLNSEGLVTNSIICSICGQCRCLACTAERPLPERWLCEGNCRLSASTVVDTVSCMCCVRPLISRCRDNHSDDACACTPSANCCARWTVFTVLSAFLPCLCCYWPMKGGVAAATACYNSQCCRPVGCSCDKT